MRAIDIAHDTADARATAIDSRRVGGAGHRKRVVGVIAHNADDTTDVIRSVDCLAGFILAVRYRHLHAATRPNTAENTACVLSATVRRADLRFIRTTFDGISAAAIHHTENAGNAVAAALDGAGVVCVIDITCLICAADDAAYVSATTGDRAAIIDIIRAILTDCRGSALRSEDAAHAQATRNVRVISDCRARTDAGPCLTGDAADVLLAGSADDAFGRSCAGFTVCDVARRTNGGSGGAHNAANLVAAACNIAGIGDCASRCRCNGGYCIANDTANVSAARNRTAVVDHAGGCDGNAGITFARDPANVVKSGSIGCRRNRAAVSDAVDGAAGAEAANTANVCARGGCNGSGIGGSNTVSADARSITRNAARIRGRRSSTIHITGCAVTLVVDAGGGNVAFVLSRTEGDGAVCPAYDARHAEAACDGAVVGRCGDGAICISRDAADVVIGGGNFAFRAVAAVAVGQRAAQRTHTISY